MKTPFVSPNSYNTKFSTQCLLIPNLQQPHPYHPKTCNYPNKQHLYPQPPPAWWLGISSRFTPRVLAHPFVHVGFRLSGLNRPYGLMPKALNCLIHNNRSDNWELLPYCLKTSQWGWNAYYTSWWWYRKGLYKMGCIFN